MTMINGIDVAALDAFRSRVRDEPALSERAPSVTARWLGADRARIEHEGRTLEIGGDGNLNAMQTLLGALAACDVEVMTTRAALFGLAIDNLEITTSGHFEVRSFLGLEHAPGSGYQRIDCRVRLRAAQVTPEQMATLQHACEHGSPVGDTLSRPVPLTTTVDGASR